MHGIWIDTPGAKARNEGKRCLAMHSSELICINKKCGSVQRVWPKASVQEAEVIWQAIRIPIRVSPLDGLIIWFKVSGLGLRVCVWGLQKRALECNPKP